MDIGYQKSDPQHKKGRKPDAQPLSAKKCFCCGEDSTTAHQTGEYPCGDERCKSSFTTTDALKLHIQNLHSENSDFACTICHVKCLDEEILKQHLDVHKQQKPFNCKKCGQHFTRKYHLERHLSHTKCSDEPNRKDLTCEVCQKNFTRLDNLREHLRGHLGQNPRKREFQCPFCDKAFYGKNKFTFFKN